MAFEAGSDVQENHAIGAMPLLAERSKNVTSEHLKKDNIRMHENKYQPFVRCKYYS